MWYRKFYNQLCSGCKTELVILKRRGVDMPDSKYCKDCRAMKERELESFEKAWNNE